MPESKKPWEKPAPKKTKTKHMTEVQIEEAKARAKKAGRPYPNLVDNMAAMRSKNQD